MTMPRSNCNTRRQKLPNIFIRLPNRFLSALESTVFLQTLTSISSMVCRFYIILYDFIASTLDPWKNLSFPLEHRRSPPGELPNIPQGQAPATFARVSWRMNGDNIWIGINSINMHKIWWNLIKSYISIVESDHILSHKNMITADDLLWPMTVNL